MKVIESFSISAYYDNIFFPHSLTFGWKAEGLSVWEQYIMRYIAGIIQ